MAYTRVLGTIGLIGATVLGAVGPMQASSTTAHATAAAAAHRPIGPANRLSTAAAKASMLQALRQGYLKTPNGHRIYLSSGLRNAFSARDGFTGATAGASSAGHANASPGPQPTEGAVRANQDFGFYLTGNGELFHNTQSVAVDPLSATHVVISATDTRLGSDGGILNISSNPTINGTNAGAECFAIDTNDTNLNGVIPTPCSLIQALGGPGVYDSVDGARTFSDLIIPDMLSGAVPDAIDQTITPPDPLPSATLPAGATAAALTGAPTAEGCIPPSGAFGLAAPVGALLPQDCLPYDSDGDQSVAFDTAGNLYDVSLGLVTSNPLPNGGFPDEPQTDIVLNVSPAVQPTGLSGSQFNPPYAAGRVFNNIAPDPDCNPFQSSTELCLHDEVTASTSSSNYLATPGDASLVGRNWDADGYGFYDDPSTGLLAVCGATTPAVPTTDVGDFCLADQPYIAINGVEDPLAYITYTLYDFNLSTSNIYVQTATVPTGVAGVLPFWSSPAQVDNNPNNPYCLGTLAFQPTDICIDDWGAMPAVGPSPDGTLYIVYESADINDPTNSSIPNAAVGGIAGTNNALLVAALQGTVNNSGFLGGALAPVLSTSFAAEVLDHDLFEAAVGTDPLLNASDPAELDPDSGAYFTIPNRPTIGVTGPLTIGPDNYPAGIVIVAWTDQRSLVLNGTTITGLSTSRGTRIWYTLGAIKYGCATVAGCVQTVAVHFDLLGRVVGGFGGGATGFLSPLAISQPTNVGDVIGTGNGTGTTPGITPGPTPSYYMAEVHEPTSSSTCNCSGVVNQFFPAIAAVQNPPASGQVSSGIPNNIFIGYYEETGAAPTVEGATDDDDTGAGIAGQQEIAHTNATMFYNVAKSNDNGVTFGVTPVTTAMPLPTIPNDPDYCAADFGFTFGADSTTGPPLGANGVPDPGLSSPTFNPHNPALNTTAVFSTGALVAQQAEANCNDVPYFGTYTGAAPDPTANGAYFAWTSTLPNTRNFLVPGSQDTTAVHVN